MYAWASTEGNKNLGYSNAGESGYTTITSTFTSTGSTTISYYMSTAGDAFIDSLSIKEITTVDMTNYIPEVVVQDQATNGLVVQSSVNAGDYVVVDKEELVTNGTFDTDTDWNKGIGWTIDATNNFNAVGNNATGDLAQSSTWVGEV